MALAERIDPYLSYNFSVDIEGIEVAAFSEVGGLTADGDPIDYREGTDPKNIVRKLVGLRKVNMIQLKRGYTSSNDLWAWYGEVMAGRIVRRQVGIILRNEARRPVLRWNIEEAWINKIDGPTFNASSNEVAIEAVDLCHEGITLEVQP